MPDTDAAFDKEQGAVCCPQAPMFPTPPSSWGTNLVPQLWSLCLPQSRRHGRLDTFLSLSVPMDCRAGGKGKNPDFYLFFVWHLSAPDDAELDSVTWTAPAWLQHAPCSIWIGLALQTHASLIRFSQGHIPSVGMSPEARITATLPSHAVSEGSSN